MNNKPEVLEFRHVKNSDPYNKNRYGHWSRYWEYPLLNKLLHTYVPKGGRIHNSSWGFEAPNHTDFKEDLESYYGADNIINSDIRSSSYPNTTVYDVTQAPKLEWINFFDAVINVSSLEEIPFDHLKCFQNLYQQVKPGGYLIITFDIPGFQLTEIEEYLGATMQRHEDAITGMGLTVGLLVCQKQTA